MIFDARTLARGWLSVALASADDEERPALHRTVSIEEFGDGVLLAATDSYVLLASWVPRIDREIEPAPDPDEAPAVTAVAMDLHGRGRGFLAHVFKLATAKDAPLIEVRLSLGVTEVDDPNRQSFSGMEATYVVLEHPDAERIKLQSYEGEYPQWRKLVAGFSAHKTSAIALNPEIVGRLARLGKLHPGAALRWRFGGADKAASIDVDGFPYVSGLVMPMPWDFDRDEPRPEPEKRRKADEDGDE